MNNSIIAQALLDRAQTFLRINTYLNLVYVMKYNDVCSANQECAISYAEFLNHFFNENSVYQGDLWQFEILKDPMAMIYYYKNGRNGTSMIYRRVVDGRIIWNRIEILIPTSHGPDCPDIFLYSNVLDSEESNFFDSFATYAARLHKIVKINFDDEHIDILQEITAERIQRRHEPVKTYSAELLSVSERYIHPDDVDDYLKHFSIENLKNYFSKGNTAYTYYCRRKIGNLFYWVKILVLPAKDGAPGTNFYYYYVENVNRDTLKLMDLNSIKIYSKYFGGMSKKNIEAYYENMLTVLHGFTQSYVDFYMVYLEKDLYIKYKFKSGVLNKAIPSVGSYSQSSNEYINEHCSKEEAEKLLLYSTSDKLRELMRDRLTLEYDFHSDTGQKLRTLCQKIESHNGVPTKVLCRTIVLTDEKQLKIQTFGNFAALYPDDTPIRFSRRQSKQLLAYLIDRHGYPVTSRDIVVDILEKPETDMNAIKYCSTLIRRTMNDLEVAGYPNVIIREQKTVRVNTNAVDCDYYHLLKGEFSYLLRYHNEYMKEYSWAETTNAEILSMVEK